MANPIKQFIDGRLPGLGVQYRKWRDDWIYAKTKPYQSSQGLVIYGDTSSHYTSSNAIEDRLESEEIKFVRSLFADIDVFVDIGANIGIFSMLAAQAGKAVVAIEAHPRNFQNLLRNLDENDIGGVECFNIALSNSVGVASLFGSGEMASLTTGWGGKIVNHSVLTATDTLDNLIGDRFPGKRLLIKMDVEGHEASVLSGAQDVLNRNPQATWFFEHGFDQHFNGINPYYLEVFEHFWRANYQVMPADADIGFLDPAVVRDAVSKGVNPYPGNLNFMARANPTNDE
ncbi:MAG: FkbM family methyltransferase [Verrucomicrobiota bacterium]